MTKRRDRLQKNPKNRNGIEGKEGEQKRNAETPDGNEVQKHPNEEEEGERERERKQRK